MFNSIVSYWPLVGQARRRSADRCRPRAVATAPAPAGPVRAHPARSEAPLGLKGPFSALAGRFVTLPLPPPLQSQPRPP